MTRLAAALLLALSACASSAPHTTAAAAVHTGLAAGFAAAGRSAGGCWAVCTNGTTCNPNTGFCEQAPPPDAALAACLPGEACARPGGEPTVAQQRPQPARAAGEGAPGVGLSPASGTAPPFPPATSVTPAPSR